MTDLLSLQLQVEEDTMSLREQLAALQKQLDESPLNLIPVIDKFGRKSTMIENVLAQQNTEESVEAMQAVLKSKGVVFSKMEKVTKMLKSRGALSRGKRSMMAKTLKGVATGLRHGFEKIEEGIAALLSAVRGGSLTNTSGYKALQENFDELVEIISQVSVLHDLAPKAFAKGLITQAQMSDMLSTNGVGLIKQASDFLLAIRTRIKHDQKAFDNFVTILKSESAYENLVRLVCASPSTSSLR